MIWESTITMVLFDLLIIVASCWALRVVLRHRDVPGTAGVMRGPLLIGLGLAVTCVFYAVDLLIMLVLPRSASVGTAQALMQDLHLNIRWPVAGAVTLAVAMGLVLSGRALVNTSRERLALAGRLRTVREEERHCISRDLHDDVGQRLTVLKLELARLQPQLSACSANASAALDGLLGDIDRSLVALQRLSYRLRATPIEELGLTRSLDWLAREVGSAAGLPTTVWYDGALSQARSPDVAEAIFRVAQEALTNTVRHARARRAWVELKERRGTITLDVGDDGIGLPAHLLGDPGSMGLRGMVERARAIGGTLDVVWPEQGGTTIRLVVPASTRGAGWVGTDRGAGSLEGAIT